MRAKTSAWQVKLKWSLNLWLNLFLKFTWRVNCVKILPWNGITTSPTPSFGTLIGTPVGTISMATVHRASPYIDQYCTSNVTSLIGFFRNRTNCDLRRFFCMFWFSQQQILIFLWKKCGYLQCLFRKISVAIVPQGFCLDLIHLCVLI